MKWFKRKQVKAPPTKLNQTTRLYDLYGESANLTYLENKVKTVSDKVDNIPIVDLTPLEAKVNTNTTNIANNSTNITNNMNRINTNIARIVANETNINGINTKINKLTTDLANANIANYKGVFNAQNAYSLGDLVSDPNNTNVYLSIINNNNKPLNDNTGWKIITFTVQTSDFALKTDITTVNNSLSNLNNRVDTVGATANTNKTDIANLTNKVNNLPAAQKTTFSIIQPQYHNLTSTYYTSGSLRGHFFDHNSNSKRVEFTAPNDIVSGEYSITVGYQLTYSPSSYKAYGVLYLAPINVVAGGKISFNLSSIPPTISNNNDVINRVAFFSITGVKTG